MNAAARLRRLAAAAPDALGPDGAWLAEAIAARLAGGAKSLDQALGLTARGGASLQVQDRNRRRDVLLQEFANTFLPDLSAARQAVALAAEIREFETRAWPRFAMRASCPAHLAGTRAGLLFTVMKTGAVPRSPKQLARILAAGHSMRPLDVPAAAA